VTDPLLDRLAVIGIGLIGGSLARRAAGGFARDVVVYDHDPTVRARAAVLGIGDRVADTLEAAVTGADVVVLAVPVGAMASVAAGIAPFLHPGAIVSDTGSTKQSVVDDVGSVLPAGVHLVPAHPMAGTEFSGPDAGFATLFEGRWCLIVPPEGADEAAVGLVDAIWQACGSNTERMTPAHHDRVVAAISHLPHLIAFTICGTAEGLAAETGEGVLKFAASGFRDFTRIAASDPVMWRDVFLNNRAALLEMLGRFERDAAAMAAAIRAGDGDFIAERVEHGRAIRRTLIEIHQA
jgi:cyclohexadieny/prephenate dehydrogenase